MPGGTVLINYCDLGMCNCAVCTKECIGEKTIARLLSIPRYTWPSLALGMAFVALREGGRPVCNVCVKKREKRAAAALKMANSTAHTIPRCPGVGRTGRLSEDGG